MQLDSWCSNTLTESSDSWTSDVGALGLPWVEGARVLEEGLLQISIQISIIAEVINPSQVFCFSGQPGAPGLANTAGRRCCSALKLVGPTIWAVL